MHDASGGPDHSPTPDPGAKSFREALLVGVSVGLGQVVGVTVRDAFGLWTYTPVVFMMVCGLVLPPIMRQVWRRLSKKAAASSSDQPRRPSP